MAIIDDLTVSAHHIVWRQTDIQEGRVVQSLPGVQVDGRLVLTIGSWEVKAPFYTCEETQASEDLGKDQPGVGAAVDGEQRELRHACQGICSDEMEI